MSAIERCRTAALGGHVERCEDCAHRRISYKSLYGDLYVKLSVGTTRGEPAHWARSKHRAATLYSVGSVLDPDHEAVIRFDGEAPRRRAHSADGIEAMELFGSPPPRLVIDGQSRKCDWAPKLCVCAPRPPNRAQVAARNTTPTGISPVMTKRHSAISSFRASATIIVVLRTPFGPSVRARYHCASALSFWNRKKRQAS